MQEIGAFEAKNTFGALLDRVQEGEEIAITRHGKVVAKLVPGHGGVDRELARTAGERIRARAERLNVRFDWAEIKADRDADRP
jgi:prevent-host-death family protein